MYKVGDRVKIVKRKPDNKFGGCDWDKPNGDVGRTGVITEIGITNKPYEVYDGDDYLGWFNDEEITLMEGTMENLKKGDVLVDVVGDDYTVGAVLEDIIFLIDRDGNTYTFYTTKELKNKGYKLKTDSPTELTAAEVSKRLGYDVKIVK